ncbi:MAG: hypothetical protein QXR39_08670 [Candidatus Methanomethylicia archaeon]
MGTEGQYTLQVPVVVEDQASFTSKIFERIKIYSTKIKELPNNKEKIRYKLKKRKIITLELLTNVFVFKMF